MKFKITAFRPSEGERDFPDEIARARDLVAMSVAAMMQLHGISRLQANAVRMGPETIKSPKLIPVKDPDIPEQVLALRNVVARTLVDVLAAYGIHDMEIQPSEEEAKKMKIRWRYLKEGDMEEPI